MLRELELRWIPATTKKLVRVEYNGLVFDEPLRFDILVDDCLLVDPCVCFWQNFSAAVGGTGPTSGDR